MARVCRVQGAVSSRKPDTIRNAGTTNEFVEHGYRTAEKRLDVLVVATDFDDAVSTFRKTAAREAPASNQDVIVRVISIGPPDTKLALILSDAYVAQRRRGIDEVDG